MVMTLCIFFVSSILSENFMNMTGCVVKRCFKYSAKHGKSSGVTFHRFPIDPVKRALWTEKIRLSRKGWNPTKNSRICSRHFEDKDKFTSKAGLCKLNKNALPTKDLFVAYILVSQDALVSKNKNKKNKESKRKLKSEVKKGNDMKLENQVKFDIEVELTEVKSENKTLMETQVKLENEVELEDEVDLENEMRAEHEIQLETQVKVENVTDDETPHIQEEPPPISSQVSPEETRQEESASTKPNCTKHRKIIRCLRQKILRLTKMNKSLKEKLKALKLRSKE